MILEVEGVDTFYGETQALFGASLAVERGKVFALLGPNGAGKTTMLRSILGLTRPTSRRDPVRRPRCHAQRDARHRASRCRLGARRPAAVPDALGRAQPRHRAKRTQFRSWTIKETCEIFSPLEYLMDRELRKPLGR